MKTIFVIGQIMSGKNILWKLLDGHSKIAVSAVHSNFAIHFLKKNVQDYYLKKDNLPSKKDRKKLNYISLKITKKISIDLTIGDYFDSLYRFTNYRTFFTLAENSCVITNNKELDNEYNTWNFDISKFQKEILKRLFSSSKEINFQDFFLETQKAYCAVVNKKFENIKYFVEPIENDPAYLSIIKKNFDNYKIITIVRDSSDLLFANMKRTGSFENTKKFYKNLFTEKNINLIKMINQYYFYKKRIYEFNKYLAKDEKGKDIILIKFEKLIFNTNDTMNKICKYLSIDFEEILLKLSANGKELKENKSTLNRINDSSEEYFNENEIKQIRKFYSKFKPNKLNFRILFFFTVLKVLIIQIIKKKEKF